MFKFQLNLLKGIIFTSFQSCIIKKGALCLSFNEMQEYDCNRKKKIKKSELVGKTRKSHDVKIGASCKSCASSNMIGQYTKEL